MSRVLRLGEIVKPSRELILPRGMKQRTEQLIETVKPTLTVTHDKPEEKMVRVIGVFEDDTSHKLKGKYDPNFKGKKGQEEKIHIDGTTFFVVGLGKRDDFNREEAEKFGAAAVRFTEKAKSSKLQIEFNQPATTDSKYVEHVIYGATLATYRQSEKIGEEEKPIDVSRINLQEFGSGREITSLIKNGVERAGFTNGSRRLTDWRPNILHPGTYPKYLAALAKEFELHYGVLSPAQLRKLNLEGIASVGAGAEHSGSLVVLAWLPEKGNKKHLALVGKGITFDSGGLSIKHPWKTQTEMHMDMEGSASVAMAVAQLARLGFGKNVVAYLCVAQNMLGTGAYTPTQTIRIGEKTVEVLNTDAEGRLVLGDGNQLAKLLSAVDVVDIATLTGAAIYALGEGVEAAAFAKDEALAKLLMSAAQESGQRIHLFDTVMRKHFLEKLESGIADMANTQQDTWGGHITAARFLIELGATMHLDIAPVMAAAGEMKKDPRFRGPEFATGYGVELLTRLAQLHAKQ